MKFYVLSNIFYLFFKNTDSSQPMLGTRRIPKSMIKYGIVFVQHHLNTN